SRVRWQFLSALFPYSCPLRLPQVLSYHILPKNTRVGGLFSALATRTSVPVANMALSRRSRAKADNSFRMRTYKTVSKQRTSTLFRMNTYKKPGGRGSNHFRNSRSPAADRGLAGPFAANLSVAAFSWMRQNSASVPDPRQIPGTG